MPAMSSLVKRTLFEANSRTRRSGKESFTSAQTPRVIRKTALPVNPFDRKNEEAKPDWKSTPITGGSDLFGGQRARRRLKLSRHRNQLNRFQPFYRTQP
jgi:hypothetical protein